MSLTDAQCQDSGALNHFQLSILMGLNHSGRSKFAYQIFGKLSLWSFDDLNTAVLSTENNLYAFTF